MSRVENFIIREGGGTRVANSLVLGAGLTLADTAGGVPELVGAFTGAKIWPAANVSVPHQTETLIACGADALDSGGFFNVANPRRLTVPPGKAGVYLVIARGVFSAGPAGGKYVGFRVNAAAVGGRSRLDEGGTSITVIATEIVRLKDGDFLDLRVFQETGTTLNAIGGAPYETSLMMTRLGV